MRTRGQTRRGGAPGPGAPSALARLARWATRLLGLFIVAVLVVGIGAGVSTPRDDTPIHSTSEQAQIDAEDRYRSLAGAARTVAAAEPALGELLTSLGQDLDVQADAVALPRSPSPDAPAPTAPSATGDGVPKAGEPAPAIPTATSAELLGSLRDSALRSLSDAIDADAGPARVLTSAGARQWQYARDLGTALDAETGLPRLDAAAVSALDAGTRPFAVPADAGAGPSAPPGTTPSAGASTATSTEAAVTAEARTGEMPPLGSECTGAPLGPVVDRRALESARTAEEQARYGYQVAAALLQDSTMLQRAAEHGAAADTAAARLSRRCVDQEPAPAGFTLSPAFREDAAAELRRLEEQHVELYAGSVATVSPESRAWAALALVAAVLRSVDSGASLRALPGIDEAGTDVTAAPATGEDANPTPTEDLTDG